MAAEVDEYSYTYDEESESEAPPPPVGLGVMRRRRRARRRVRAAVAERPRCFRKANLPQGALLAFARHQAYGAKDTRSGQDTRGGGDHGQGTPGGQGSRGGARPQNRGGGDAQTPAGAAAEGAETGRCSAPSAGCAPEAVGVLCRGTAR